MKAGSNDQSSPNAKKEKNILGEAADSIEESAKLVSEKATELSGKLKKGLAQAYDTGAKVVDELSHIAQEYSEKYKAESEIKKLKTEKDALLSQLGEAFYKHRLSGEDFTDTFFHLSQTEDLLKQIDAVDQKIVKTSKQLDLKKE